MIDVDKDIIKHLKLFCYLQLNPDVSAVKIASEFDIGETWSRGILYKLEEKGLVERNKQSGEYGGYSYLWHVSEKGIEELKKLIVNLMKIFREYLE